VATGSCAASHRTSREGGRQAVIWCQPTVKRDQRTFGPLTARYAHRVHTGANNILRHNLHPAPACRSAIPTRTGPWAEGAL